MFGDTLVTPPWFCKFRRRDRKSQYRPHIDFPTHAQIRNMLFSFYSFRTFGYPVTPMRAPPTKVHKYPVVQLRQPVLNRNNDMANALCLKSGKCCQCIIDSEISHNFLTACYAQHSDHQAFCRRSVRFAVGQLDNFRLSQLQNLLGFFGVM